MKGKSDKPIVVGLGEVLWDLLPAGRELGGAPANFAYHAHVLGARGMVASCVGQDDLGEEILTRLDTLGVDRVAVAVDPNHTTGTVSVELSDTGQPSYVIHENVAWDHIPASETMLTSAVRADAVCFGTLAQRSEESRRTIQQFLASTRHTCLKVFDINLPQHFYSTGIIETSLQHSNVLKLNDEELPVVSDALHLHGNRDALLPALIEKYQLRLIVLTCGSEGSLLQTSDESSFCKPQPVDVVDTVGAGDSFAAAVTVGLLNGLDLKTLHRHADAVARYVCSQPGATSELPPELTKPSLSEE